MKHLTFSHFDDTCITTNQDRQLSSNGLREYYPTNNNPDNLVVRTIEELKAPLPKSKIYFTKENTCPIMQWFNSIRQWNGAKTDYVFKIGQDERGSFFQY